MIIMRYWTRGRNESVKYFTNPAYQFRFAQKPFNVPSLKNRLGILAKFA